ncbi:hypothetical protein C8R43DRAFT_958077 [Mycena crocata]|nr:hypothetical protein C8R43DRAFT_958077 [Mycena crocata]
MSAPPPYDSPQRISPPDISRLFADLSISASESLPSEAENPSSAQGSASINMSPTIQDVERLYTYSTLEIAGLTETWDVAASQTQGVPGGSPLLLTPKSKKRSKKGGFAIFHGRRKGAFRHWHEVAPLVIGVSNSIYQGYPMLELARAAFEYALQRGWTRICGSGPTTLTSLALPASAVSSLPSPIGLLDVPSPLHAGGILSTGGDCLNTRGLSCATYDSCKTRAIAVLRFQTALAAGNVKVLRPVYSA